MKRSAVFISTLLLIFMLGCQSNQQEGSSEEKVQADKDGAQFAYEAEKALSLLEIHCNGCHNPDAPSHDELKAPPLVATKFRYKQSHPEREAFITNMADFLNNPSREKALMPNAIDRFGAKFKSALNKEQLTAIAAYMYDHELEEPDWFAEHFEEEHGVEWKQ